MGEEEKEVHAQAVAELERWTQLIKWVFGIGAAVMGIVIGSWVISVNEAQTKHASEIAVLKTQYANVAENMKEVKCGVDKLIVKMDEVRGDQVRREIKERP